jgi:prepilin-type N-terminal cleavage/methylation domain-containing protein
MWRYAHQLSRVIPAKAGSPVLRSFSGGAGSPPFAADDTGLCFDQNEICIRDDRCAGFTLIEVLAALAVGSVIIIATAALIHDVARNFDRGTRRAQEAERLMLAVERLAQDLNSVRYVGWTTDNGATVAFSGVPATEEKPAQIAFVGNAGIMAGPQGEEVVTLTVERAGDRTRLVRRRAAWTGPRTRLEAVSTQDAVVLVEGAVDISFIFGHIAPNGALEWSESWIGQTTLPRFVRLILRDRATGADLLGEADFAVRADAPAGCGRPDAATSCLSPVWTGAAQ